MTISSINSATFPSALGGNPLAKLKKSFDDLSNALQSGNLSDAKNALAQLEKYAPPQTARGNNPLSDKINALSKALDAGDLSGAQKAFADIKNAIAQHKSGTGGPPRGAPPGGGPPPGAGHGSGASSSASSSQDYDPKDTNKDGRVSLQEELAYDLKSVSEQPQLSNNLNGKTGTTSIDTLA